MDLAIFETSFVWITIWKRYFAFSIRISIFKTTSKWKWYYLLFCVEVDGFDELLGDLIWVDGIGLRSCIGREWEIGVGSCSVWDSLREFSLVVISIGEEIKTFWDFSFVEISTDHILLCDVIEGAGAINNWGANELALGLAEIGEWIEG